MDSKLIKMAIISFTWLIILHVGLSISPLSVQNCTAAYCSLALGESLMTNGLLILYLISLTIFASSLVTYCVRNYKKITFGK